MSWYEYTTVGSCKKCGTPIQIDDPYTQAGKHIFDGVICEKCGIEKKLREIEDYISGCEDDDGYIFDNQAESLLNGALGIIHHYRGLLAEVKTIAVDCDNDTIADLITAKLSSVEK